MPDGDGEGMLRDEEVERCPREAARGSLSQTPCWGRTAHERREDRVVHPTGEELSNSGEDLPRPTFHEGLPEEKAGTAMGIGAPKVTLRA